MGLSKKQCDELGIGHLFPKRGRKAAHVRFVMNKTEARFAVGCEARKLAGEIKSWAFEEDTFRLGPEMTFTPDFRIEPISGPCEYLDVKGGHIWEDATIKAKTAALLFPWHRFGQAQWKNGVWKIRWFRSELST